MGTGGDVQQSVTRGAHAIQSLQCRHPRLHQLTRMRLKAQALPERQYKEGAERGLQQVLAVVDLVANTAHAGVHAPDIEPEDPGCLLAVRVVRRGKIDAHTFRVHDRPHFQLAGETPPVCAVHDQPTSSGAHVPDGLGHRAFRERPHLFPLLHRILGLLCKQLDGFAALGAIDPLVAALQRHLEETREALGVVLGRHRINLIQPPDRPSFHEIRSPLLQVVRLEHVNNSKK
mmetsp:Transcript_30428/g.78609  ORF Transcript_30428/g.78609 Transcript_30428/m.78609 type:complete len:231 (+) Transcript_30428:1893-2585(+)